MSNILNKAQKEAVMYNDGPLLIVAGAGTGKTTVITQKIAHLVKNKLTMPEQILALTFTDKAALEMGERVDQLLDISYAEMQISTFHAFCQRLLERYGLDIGLSNQFTLLTETDAWLLVRQNLHKFDLDYYRPLGNPTRHIHELIKHFQKCKDELITPEEYLDYAENVKLNQDKADIDEKTRLTEISKTYHQYNQLLLDNNALDFADLIFYAVRLLETRPKIRQTLQEQFKYILVDEFQDVNWSQYKLVQMLTSNNNQLTVVGDDDQSIYAFRGASVSNIMRFKDDYKNAKEVILTENYRSGQEILDIAYQSVQNNNPDRLEIKLKINKKLKSKIVEKSFVEVIKADTVEDEAKLIIKEMVELKKKDETASWDDFTILVRANSHAEPFLQALEARDIPYEFLASSGLYRQPIILDCINFFKLVDNYHESSAVYRLLHLPFFNFSEEDVQKFTGMAKMKSISYYEALVKAEQFRLSKEGAIVCQKLATLIKIGMKTALQEKPTAVLYEFLEKIGYLAYLTAEENQGNKEIIRQIYQLKQFFDYLGKYEQRVPDACVSGFMEHYNQIREADDEGKLYQVKETSDSVNIMTVHASKGMEFKYVFIVNLVEQRFPTRSRGDAIEIPVELIKEQLPEGDGHYQEERRLFYVAMTRAKKRLYLSYANNYGGNQLRKVSRFLDELGLDSGKNNIRDNKMKAPIAEIKSKTKIAVKKGKVEYELPKIFSFSQIKSYQTCPYQYKLSHILKIPHKGSASFSFGTTIHNTLHKFYKRVQELNAIEQSSLFSFLEVETPKKINSNKIKTPELSELLNIYEKSWVEDWYASKRQREEYYKKGKDILKRFYRLQENNWTIPVIMEKGFKIKIGKYTLSGRVDRVDKLSDGTLEIIDYKTGKTKEKVTGDEKDQLLIYQIVAETLPEYRNIGVTGKLTYYFVEEGVKTEFIGKQTDLNKLRDKIEETIEKIHQRDFTATPSKFICQWCEFRDICEFRE